MRLHQHGFKTVFISFDNLKFSNISFGVFGNFCCFLLKVICIVNIPSFSFRSPTVDSQNFAVILTFITTKLVCHQKNYTFYNFPHFFKQPLFP